MARLLSVLILLSVAVSVYCDIYLHNPRGSNDRLNEASDRNNANRLFRSENNAAGGYCWGPSMTYYAGSKLTVEWTNQHGCGNPNLNCNLVLQYMCNDNVNGDPNSVVRDGDGSTTNTIPTDPVASQQQDSKGQYIYGMNENYNYYLNCSTRQRNKGLFTADQNMNNNAGAMATRQENNGNRYGFECGEEAIYYPYWHPSPWKDIAVFTNQASQCKYYTQNSQNVLSKNYCSGTPAQYAFNNQNDCLSNGGQWTSQPSWGMDAPDCLPAPYNRDNHLGNGVTGYTNTYNWTLPTASTDSCISGDTCGCVLRLRYNISTAEIAWTLDSTSNGQNSPVLGDPYVMVAGNNLSLALDTSEYGRTFQDRSFVFQIAPRPSGVSSSANIYNLNIRGKRGNIVQTYPAVEYDFSPNNLAITVGDYVHFQWTGCDTNPAGQAGEGIDQTDRSNIVQMSSLAANYPYTDTAIAGSGVNKLFENDSDRANLAFLGQQGCKTYEQLQQSNDQDPQDCAKLNAATAYYNGGLIRMNNTGTFFYMSTRNNNFSNRTQKGTLTVKPVLPAYAIALIVVGGVVGVGAAATAGTVMYAKKNPSSGAANFVAKVPGLNRI